MKKTKRSKTVKSRQQKTKKSKSRLPTPPSFSEELEKEMQKNYSPTEELDVDFFHGIFLQII